jgi:putative hydrolase of the HAD superfamily
MACSFFYFDLGNVLLSFCHDRMCLQLAEVAGLDAAVVRQALLEVDGAHARQMQFERGDITAEDYYEFFCQQTGTRPDRTALEQAGSDIFEPMEPSMSLVGALAEAGHRLGILSNVGPVHWNHVSSGHFPMIPESFEVLVLSYEVRSVKPEPDIYRQAISRAGVPAGEIFFVDDRKENVAGALKAGIDAVLFTSTAQLVDDLRSRGVVPRS